MPNLATFTKSVEFRWSEKSPWKWSQDIRASSARGAAPSPYPASWAWRNPAPKIASRIRKVSGIRTKTAESYFASMFQGTGGSDKNRWFLEFFLAAKVFRPGVWCPWRQLWQSLDGLGSWTRDLRNLSCCHHYWPHLVASGKQICTDKTSNDIIALNSLWSWWQGWWIVCSIILKRRVFSWQIWQVSDVKIGFALPCLRSRLLNDP